MPAAPQPGPAGQSPANPNYASRMQPPAQVGGPQPAGAQQPQGKPGEDDSEFQAWLRQLFAEHQSAAADQSPKWNQGEDDGDHPDKPESAGSY